MCCRGPPRWLSEADGIPVKGELQDAMLPGEEMGGHGREARRRSLCSLYHAISLEEKNIQTNILPNLTGAR